MPSSHLFSCHQADCCNMTTELGSTCDACRQDWRRCPDCGDMGATVLGSNYCHECYSRRNHPCNAPPAADGWCPECDMYTVVLPNICAKCQQKRDDVCTCDGGEPCAGCAHRIAEAAEYDVWCGVDEPQCTCNRETGLMCDLCAEEYAEPCRGCGVSSQLWTDNTYCRTCYVERYGDEFPNEHAAAHAEEIAHLHSALGRAIAESDTRSQDQIQLLLEDHGYKFPPLPPSPEPRHTSLQSMRDEIAEIEARLQTNMTKGQKDDWVWLLLNRRADLAEAEKEMWAGFDADDLRKLDLLARY
jgi:hypothetical protein